MTDVVWVAVLFAAAANPARHAGRLAAAGSGRRDAIVAAGVAIAAVVAAAGLADPLLDALDVTLPSARIAAGVVAGVAGVRDLLGSEPPAWEPVLVRPEVVLPAVVAGADEGAVLTALVAAVAIGATAVLATRTMGRTGRMVAHVSARMLGAALIVVGVDLVVDGVLDV